VHRKLRLAGSVGRLVVAAILVLGTPVAARSLTGNAAFHAWLETLWPDAQALEISRGVFDDAIRGLEPDLGLPDLVVPGRTAPAPEQPEFVRTPAEYLAEASLGRLAARAKTLLEQYRSTLAGIEQQFGVPASMLLAIWGRETDFGTYRLPKNAVAVLATQAYLGRRKEQFRQEFLMALKIVQDGEARLADLRSSWAGAMGLTQFLPSEYYKYGVDFDGDGRRDIWTSVPDALASAAKQLIDKGWQVGRGWAYEVHPPTDLDCTRADPDFVLPISEWLQQGYVPARRRKIGGPDLLETASLFLPEGLYGPAFLTLKNFYVLKAYNYADLYALFVGHLSDRLTDPRSFETPWAKVPQLRTRELEEMQRRMTSLGYYRDKIDGKAGQKTRLALGTYQKATGQKVDCWPTALVLNRLRADSAR
jgi:lytic murein transglycosylase